MERIKDFIYEKSDVFFASIVIIIVVGVIFYNLRGWMFIDGEMSKYHQVQTSAVSDQSSAKDPGKPDDTAPSSNDAPTDNDPSSTPVPSDKNGTQNDPPSDSSPSSSKKPEDKSKPEDQKTPEPDQKSDAAQTEQKPKENTDDNKSNADKNTAQKPAEQKNTAQKPQNASSSKSITIAPGSSAGEIAASLKSNGLISDTDAFLNKVVSSGKESKLKAGTFSIPGNASVDQIIGILTK